MFKNQCFDLQYAHFVNICLKEKANIFNVLSKILHFVRQVTDISKSMDKFTDIYYTDRLL